MEVCNFPALDDSVHHSLWSSFAGTDDVGIDHGAASHSQASENDGAGSSVEHSHDSDQVTSDHANSGPSHPKESGEDRSAPSEVTSTGDSGSGPTDTSFPWFGGSTSDASANATANTGSDKAADASSGDAPAKTSWRDKLGLGSSDSDKGMGCFAGNVEVFSVLAHRAVRMSELQAGDVVLAYDTDRKAICPSRVVGFLHRDPQSVCPMITISLKNSAHRAESSAPRAESGGPRVESSPISSDSCLGFGSYTVRLTPDHLTIGSGGRSNRAIDSCRALTCSFFDMTANARSIKVDSVCSFDFESSQPTGVYAPMTESGTIIVNGLVFSCYACPLDIPLFSHEACHRAVWLSRTLQDLGVTERIPADGVEPCAKGLHTVVSRACRLGRDLSAQVY